MWGKLKSFGSKLGVTLAKDVRELLKHWKQSRKMMKKMGGKPEKLMKKFKLPI